MKNLLFLFIFLNAIQSNAETFSESRAKAMINVLQSKQMKTLLQQEDGVGNIVGINYLNSMTTDVADRFEVTFYSYSGISQSNCSVIARVDGVSGGVSLSSPKCVEINKPKVNEGACKNPSPIGCLD